MVFFILNFANGNIFYNKNTTRQCADIYNIFDTIKVNTDRNNIQQNLKVYYGINPQFCNETKQVLEDKQKCCYVSLYINKDIKNPTWVNFCGLIKDIDHIKDEFFKNETKRENYYNSFFDKADKKETKYLKIDCFGNHLKYNYAAMIFLLLIWIF